jgi:hypothetical protein
MILPGSIAQTLKVCLLKEDGILGGNNDQVPSAGQALQLVATDGIDGNVTATLNLNHVADLEGSHVVCSGLCVAMGES